MGQYYKAVSLDDRTYLFPHDYVGERKEGVNGLKLLEHSYIGNWMLNAVENLIKRGGRWFGHRIVWAGNYADIEKERNEERVELGLPIDTTFGENVDQNVYDLVENRLILPVEYQRRNFRLRFLVNFDRNEFVDLSKVPKIEGWDGRFHPLPFLTCEGNGRGGGDFHTSNPKYLDIIGRWARDRITIQTKKPASKDMKEIIFDLVED